MAYDPFNTWTLGGCGLVADPEVINDGAIVKLRLAKDYAGGVRGTDDKRGFFDAVHFRSDTTESRFIFDQIEKGNLKKGSQVILEGRANNPRWEKDGRKGSAIEMIVNSLSYMPRSADRTTPASEEESVPVPTRF